MAHWLRHGGDSGELADDVQLFNLPAELLDEVDAEETFEVWPENMASLRGFGLVQTQWRWVAGAGMTGLDYAGVEACLRLSGVEDVQAVFADIRVMEAAMLRTMREEK